MLYIIYIVYTRMYNNNVILLYDSYILYKATLELGKNINGLLIIDIIICV